MSAIHIFHQDRVPQLASSPSPADSISASFSISRKPCMAGKSPILSRRTITTIPPSVASWRNRNQEPCSQFPIGILPQRETARGIPQGKRDTPLRSRSLRGPPRHTRPHPLAHPQNSRLLRSPHTPHRHRLPSRILHGHRETRLPSPRGLRLRKPSRSKEIHPPRHPGEHAPGIRGGLLHPLRPEGSLATALLHGLKNNPGDRLVDGSDDVTLHFSKILPVAIALSRHIQAETDKPRVAIILPPGKGGMVANIAVLFAGTRFQ